MAFVLTDEEALPKVNAPPARNGDLVIAGPALEKAIRAGMARSGDPSLTAFAKRSGIRRDTFYRWFGLESAHLSAGSVDKLVAAVGSVPGDPWHQEPIVKTLDAESLAALDAAVERAMDRLGDRLVEYLDERLPHSGTPDGSLADQRLGRWQPRRPGRQRDQRA